jgi:hypothetical protein
MEAMMKYWLLLASFFLFLNAQSGFAIDCEMMSQSVYDIDRTHTHVSERKSGSDYVGDPSVRTEVEIHTEKERCARITFRLIGYGSRLKENSHKYFIAVFADGFEQEAATLNIGSNRLEGGQTYTGSVCFGVNETPITNVYCLSDW